MPGVTQTIEQQRAKYAWECVQKALDLDKGAVTPEYLSLARKFPSMVQTNGLGQSLAFLLSKGKNDNRHPASLISNHLAAWLCAPQGKMPAIYSGELPLSRFTLMDCIVQGDSATLRRATAETLALYAWIKRFAEAFEKPTALPNEPTTQNTTKGEAHADGKTAAK